MMEFIVGRASEPVKKSASNRREDAKIAKLMILLVDENRVFFRFAFSAIFAVNYFNLWGAGLRARQAFLSTAAAAGRDARPPN